MQSATPADTATPRSELHEAQEHAREMREVFANSFLQTLEEWYYGLGNERHIYRDPIAYNVLHRLYFEVRHDILHRLDHAMPVAS